MSTKESMRWRVSAAGETTEVAFDAPPQEPIRGIHVLAHGAGGNMETRGLLREAKILQELGIGVVRFNFFYREAHRSYPDKMPHLIACYSAVVESLAERIGADLRARPSAKGKKTAGEHGGAPSPLYLGGHSMGGRVSTMMAAEGFSCDGLILFSYPLHPPGKFEQLRAEHLPRIKVPVLCINGTRDDFMRRDLMEKLLPMLPATWKHHWVEHADHSLAVRKKDGRSNTEVDVELRETIAAWLDERGV